MGQAYSRFGSLHKPTTGHMDKYAPSLQTPSAKRYDGNELADKRKVAGGKKSIHASEMHF